AEPDLRGWRVRSSSAAQGGRLAPRVGSDSRSESATSGFLPVHVEGDRDALAVAEIRVDEVVEPAGEEDHHSRFGPEDDALAERVAGRGDHLGERAGVAEFQDAAQALALRLGA